MTKSGEKSYMAVEFGHALNDFYKGSAAVVADVDWGPSLTRQEFAEDCDINVIMARYETTGMAPGFAREPQYLDLTAMPPDLQSTLNLLHDAERQFMTLPATVRREFDNDPVQFVEFASDPENLPQMRTWKLAPDLEVPATTLKDVVDALKPVAGEIAPVPNKAPGGA